MKSILIALCLIACVKVTAQQDYSGLWKLKDSIHFLSGPRYINALPKEINVIQASDSLILETISEGGKRGDVKGRQSYPLNGKPLTIDSSPTMRKNIKTLSWNVDKGRMTLTRVMYVPGSDSEVSVTWIEEWSITDGELYISKRSIETKAENWEVKAMYSKQ